MRLKPSLVNNRLVTRPIAEVGGWWDLMIWLACGHIAPSDVASAHYRAKFLNSPWNLYSFVRLAT
jgi:hypothetical protein